MGVSNVDRQLLRRARSVAEVVSVQNRYNPLDRRSEMVLELCERLRIIFLPWAPLEQGRERFDGVAEIARRHDATPYQIVLAWLLMRSPAMLPIPGTGSVRHVEQDVAAAAIELTPQEYEQIDHLREQRMAA